MFSWDRIADAFENLYECVIEDKAMEEFRSPWGDHEPAGEPALLGHGKLAAMFASRLLGERASHVAAATALLAPGGETTPEPADRRETR